MKFSRQTILALTVVAVLIAAIYGERQRTTELSNGIASTEEWLESFNHHSIECLPYYRKALVWDDPVLSFAKQLVAKVEQQQKLIESMPDHSESEVSVIEVATIILLATRMRSSARRKNSKSRILHREEMEPRDRETPCRP